MATRRGKGTLVPQKNTPDKEPPTPRSIAATDAIMESTPHEDTELLAIKLNRNYDKVARYESHQEYLTTCIKDQLIPINFKVQLELSIGNHDETFLSTWYNKIQKFSIDLMKDTIKFCENTIIKTISEIQSQEEELKNQTDQEEYHEINTTIRKYNEQKIKELKRDKTAKHRRLRWNLSSKQKQDSIGKQSFTQTNQKSQTYPQRKFPNYANESKHSRETPRHTEALSYADILKPKYSNRRTRPTAGNINYNEYHTDRIPNTIPSTKFRRPQPLSYGYANNNFPKNITSPRPAEVEGGMQELLANTMEAFKLLQNNFERLVVLKTTQMEK